eukprot:TRINITY_DN6931_c0_g2_i1.p1 TRINITY_DN6931_c0_g2~~TRINITY_DN6931_c0_g2_i1.p1  ORF type:complete len:859 (+),score=195.27 TRINITY_DN6931_c0_g2_i1:130-2706(+)
MSHATYQMKWTECMQELMEQVQIEYLPAEAAENGQYFEPGFQHFALLYIKYLQIYRKLEDCHDQMVHPQKRRSIKKVLKSTIVRILELKQQLIFYNPRHRNRFVALDEVLTDLKLNPETVEWRVPRYFLDDKECKEEIQDKKDKIDHWLTVFNMNLEASTLIDQKDPFDIGLSTDQAVERIQKNERGRMGINKLNLVIDWRRDSQRKEERQRRQAERGESGQDDLLEVQVLAATRIAAHWKRKADRKRFLRMVQDEFEFLGMQPKRSDTKQMMPADMNQAREHRKRMQVDADEAYEKALNEQLEWLHEKKGADIKAYLLEERRQWILDYSQQPEKGLKFPAEFDEFYQRFDKEEEVEDAGKDAKGKGKDAKGKDAKGKDGKDGKKGKDAKGKVVEEEQPHDVGPSAVVQQFVEHINQYSEMWENRDESENFDQRHDVELARKQVFPIVEAELRAVVDELMKEELANLKVLFAEAKKKKPNKGGKKGPKPPKPPKQKKWCPAVGTVSNREDCMPDLIEMGVLKKIKPCHLEDFWGEYNYLGAMQRSHFPHCPQPSAQMIRSLIVEHCVLPLAAPDLRQKAPESLVARSLLLYGPKGTGKSMLARAIATETGATFFDLSPAVIDGKSTQGKLGSSLLIYKVFLCAQDMAPSVVYIDQIDQVFQLQKKKKGGDANSPVRIKKDLIAAIKQVKRGPESTEQDRILFIGCSSKPYVETVDSKELLLAFDEKIWVNFPEYGSRVMLWKKFMEQHKVPVDRTNIKLSTLASVSEYFSAGAIKQTVDRVLTTRRVQKLDDRPLKETEFVGPLSRTSMYAREGQDPRDVFKLFRDFDVLASGEKDLFLKKQQEDQAAELEAAKKGKR